MNKNSWMCVFEKYSYICIYFFTRIDKSVFSSMQLKIQKCIMQIELIWNNVLLMPIIKKCIHHYSTNRTTLTKSFRLKQKSIIFKCFSVINNPLLQNRFGFPWIYIYVNEQWTSLKTFYAHLNFIDEDYWVCVCGCT